jgi:oxygen-independent coproporphyrinogen III oxidase
MAGIYIHIPFCKSKCIYCNFYSVASSLHVNDFCELLLKEIEMQRNYLEGETVSTVYFGGGTPSLLPESFIAEVIEKIHQTFKVSDDPEIALEANPDDVSDKKLKEWRHASINRISLGTQSFNEDDLKFLKRIHNASQAETSVKRSQDAGFENVSIDLIYGIPVQTKSSWKENIEKAFSLQVPHISAYALTVEEKTVLSKHILSKKLQPINEEQAVSQYKILMNEMREHNFLHYEISNFCKDGFFSKHNISYWKDVKYLGLGPSAHSYNHISRQWNTANLIDYLKSIAENKIPAEKEILNGEQKLNEYIMTSLRTMWGCDLAYIEKTYGAEEKNRILDLSKSPLDKGYIEIKNEIIFLTDEGKLFADGIASELFIAN